MRKIKFRAWNQKEKYMCDVLDLGEIWNGAEFQTLNNIDDSGKRMLISDYNEIIIMQFTGLKDKNGKEIYEGDILIERKYERHSYTRCIVKYGKYIECDYEYYPNQMGFYLQDIYNKKEQHDLWGAISWQEFEVIGNIYEDKELLEGNDANTGKHKGDIEK